MPKYNIIRKKYYGQHIFNYLSAAARLWKYVTFAGTAVSLAWAAAEIFGHHEEDEEYKPVAYRAIKYGNV